MNTQKHSFIPMCGSYYIGGNSQSTKQEQCGDDGLSHCEVSAEVTFKLATQGVIEKRVDQMEIKVQGLGLMELDRQPHLHWKTLNHICPMGVPITRVVSKWIQNHLVHPLEQKLIPQLLMKLFINKRG